MTHRYRNPISARTCAYTHWLDGESPLFNITCNTKKKRIEKTYIKTQTNTRALYLYIHLPLILILLSLYIPNIALAWCVIYSAKSSSRQLIYIRKAIIIVTPKKKVTLLIALNPINIVGLADAQRLCQWFNMLTYIYQSCVFCWWTFKVKLIMGVYIK